MTEALANQSGEEIQVIPARARLRQAVELRWAKPGISWSHIAKVLGISRNRLYILRQSPEWHQAWRDVSGMQMDDLAIEARTALRIAWRKGNPTGAIEVLRSQGVLSKDGLDIQVSGTVTHEVKVPLNPEEMAEAMSVLYEHSPKFRAAWNARHAPKVIDVEPKLISAPIESSVDVSQDTMIEEFSQ